MGFPEPLYHSLGLPEVPWGSLTGDEVCVPTISVSVMSGPEKQNDVCPVPSPGDNTLFRFKFEAHTNVTPNTVLLYRWIKNLNRKVIISNIKLHLQTFASQVHNIHIYITFSHTASTQHIQGVAGRICHIS
jgi:hypothetical protein